MQVTNIDLDNLLGPGPHKYDAIRFDLAQACLRVNATHTLTNKQHIHLGDLGLLSNGKLLAKGAKFMFEVLRVSPA